MTPRSVNLFITYKGGKRNAQKFGLNLKTGLLHVSDWGNYEVWNSRSQKSHGSLSYLPRISLSNLAQSYLCFSSQLQKLAGELQIDLVQLEGFPLVKKLMTKGQIVTHFAGKFEISKKAAASSIDEYAGLAIAETKKKGAFVLPGIGRSALVKRKARIGRNPATGETIKVRQRQL